MEYYPILNKIEKKMTFRWASSLENRLCCKETARELTSLRICTSVVSFLHMRKVATNREELFQKIVVFRSHASHSINASIQNTIGQRDGINKKPCYEFQKITPFCLFLTFHISKGKFVTCDFNPIEPNRISNPYHLDKSVLNLRVVGL